MMNEVGFLWITTQVVSCQSLVNIDSQWIVITRPGSGRGLVSLGAGEISDLHFQIATPMGVSKCNDKQPVTGAFVRSSPIFAIGPNGFNGIWGNIKYTHLTILINVNVQQRHF